MVCWAVLLYTAWTAALASGSTRPSFDTECGGSPLLEPPLPAAAIGSAAEVASTLASRMWRTCLLNGRTSPKPASTTARSFSRSRE